MATSVEINIQRELENLGNELNLIKQRQKNENNKRILYLVEQSAIAKELGLELRIRSMRTLWHKHRQAACR